MAVQRALILATFTLSALAAPAPRPQIANDDAPGYPVPPVGASGSLYATATLLGPRPLVPHTLTSGFAPATVASTAYQLLPQQTADATDGVIFPYEQFSALERPEPIRGANGYTDSGPDNPVYARINPDLYARPGTDSGNVANAKWPMGLSSNRAGSGKNSGFARQQNVDELPIAKEMAGVDMALAPNAYRELHWHSANEWSYIFNGSVRVSAVNQNGETFVDDLQAGDLWFFPAGVPHSIQAGPNGTEFLLVFDEGTFSEDDTDLVTELFLRNPREVLAKNFQTDISTFDNIPSSQKYIFDGTPFAGTVDDAINSTVGPAGLVPRDEYYSYHLSQQAPLVVPGGSVKIVDPTTFPIANNFSVAIFTIEPGAMRELHWHLTSDEWNFFLKGNARLTSFAGPMSSRTFDFSEGDVGYIPVANSHYIENIGNETVMYMEILQAPKYQDISAAQWLGLTPKQVVQETMGFSDEFLATLPKDKRYIVPGNSDYTTTNFTVGSYPNSEQKRDAGLKNEDIARGRTKRNAAPENKILVPRAPVDGPTPKAWQRHSVVLEH